MADAPDARERNFLRRWSQRKLAAARAEETAAKAPAPAADAAAAPPPEAPPRPDVAEAAAPEAPPALPDIATLTFDSDYKAFLAPGVDEGTRRAALRKLFADPRFNVQDGLDVYIDDYSKFEPMTPDVLAKLAHARHVLDPPRTRINEQGYAEDVLDEPPRPDAPAVAATPVPAEVAPGAVEAPRDEAPDNAGTPAPPALSDAVPRTIGATDAAAAMVAPPTEATRSAR